jgi:hypothetical protein
MVMKAPQTAVLARAAILLAALAVTCLLLAGCRGTGAPQAEAASPTTTSAPASTAVLSSAGASGTVFDHVHSNPSATVTGGRLYVAWQVNQAGARVPRFELVRADQATGAIEATHRLGAGYLGTPLVAGGWLWMTTSTAAGEWLLRMNPADLALTGDISIGGRSYQGFTGSDDDLAVAGAVLWVTSGNRLLRVSLRTGQVMAVIALPGAYSSRVGASADGTVLVVSEANDSGLGSLQRRDPVTGALIASHPMGGVTAPLVGGIVSSGVWVAEPTGMLGYIERFSTATMAPDPATDVGGSNGINVRVADGVIWVTEHVNSRHNYCADPATGRVLGRIPLPDPEQDYVLAIGSRYVYYQAPVGDGFSLKRIGVPATCRALSGSVHPCPVPLDRLSVRNMWKASSFWMKPATPAARPTRRPCITPRRRCTWRFPATCSTRPASSC